MKERRKWTITEPTVEQYVYYLRQIEGDDRRTIQKRRDAFAREVSALLAHLEHLSGHLIPPWEWPQESEDRHISQRIIRTKGWLDNPQTGRSYFLESRTYGDVYWLQVGYYQQGETEQQVFASLRDEMWQPTSSEHLLGSSVYLCGIVDGDEAQLAPQLLQAYTGDQVTDLASTRIAKCRAEFYGSSEHPHVTTILYTTPKCEKWVGDHILNDIAIRFELYKHKADRQLAWCATNYPILSGQERQLREMLEQIDPTSPVDQERLGQFIQLYQVFSSNASLLAERQTTIDVNLNNLDAVLQELSLKKDRFLSAVRDRLQGKQRQLRADLAFADHTRERADAVVNALKVRLALEQRLDLGPEQVPQDVIEPDNWPGTSFRGEASQTTTYPEVHPAHHIRLSVAERTIIQHVYVGFAQVLIKNEFGGGYGGTRVLLAHLITPEGMPAAQRVIKLGPILELDREREKYTQFVSDFLPFSAARVEAGRYYERDGQAGLSYIFVGGGGLGQAQDLEEYYHRAASTDTIERVAKTLDNLLDRELGQRWYGNTTPLYCFFAAEYGQHLVEHLRLKLRPASSDALWPVDQPPTPLSDYRRVAENDIPREHEAVEPGTLIVVEEMVVRKIKHGLVKLEDTGGQGTIVRVVLAPGSDVPQWLVIGARVGVRGEVVYNRRGRLEQIVCTAFPELAGAIKSPSIALSGVSGAYPNPLTIYPQVLGRLLESRRSFVHGDLHLRNVLVDEWGKGWLIDFAHVERRHNLFDFIKLEIYIRLMGLANHAPTFSLDEYAQFEQALNDATLGRGSECPDNPDLRAAYHLIRAIRRIARKYMGHEPNFEKEYFPALFLYSLAMLKYFQPDAPHPTHLIWITNLVLSITITIVLDKPPSEQPTKGEIIPQPPLGIGNRWAVLVGVDEYEDEINYGRLHVCVKDVEAIRERLIAGGFDPGRVHLLTDQTSESPTRAKILLNLKAVADATKPDDLLLFYYSGHGDEDERGDESYLVTRDGARLVLGDTAVPISRIKDIVERAPARAKVIILDACHSGADVGGKGAKPMSPEFIRRVFEEAEGMAILASCMQGQLSREWQERERSVFTHYLLEALTGEADLDEKGFVTVQDASRHVTDGVKLWASQHNTSQTPTLQYTVAGDIILVRYS